MFSTNILSFLQAGEERYFTAYTARCDDIETDVLRRFAGHFYSDRMPTKYTYIYQIHALKVYCTITATSVKAHRLADKAAKVHGMMR